MQTINLVSTVVVGSFANQKVLMRSLTVREFCAIISNAKSISNYCGHPKTLNAFAEAGLSIPPQITRKDSEGKEVMHPKFNTPMGAFWNGEGIAVAARPKGGTRAAQTQGDTDIDGLDELEFVIFKIEAVESVSLESFI